MTGEHTAERLMQVVRVLEKLPKDKKFDLRAWAVCGTTACAAGWAGFDPWFRRRGFKTVRDGGGYSICVKRGPFSEYAYTACSIFFQIGEAHTHKLFSPRRYARGSKYDVIRRIRKFVREECG